MSKECTTNIPKTRVDLEKLMIYTIKLIDTSDKSATAFLLDLYTNILGKF